MASTREILSASGPSSRGRPLILRSGIMCWYALVSSSVGTEMPEKMTCESWFCHVPSCFAPCAFCCYSHLGQPLGWSGLKKRRGSRRRLKVQIDGHLPCSVLWSRIQGWRVESGDPACSKRASWMIYRGGCSGRRATVGHSALVFLPAGVALLRCGRGCR